MYVLKVSYASSSLLSPLPLLHQNEAKAALNSSSQKYASLGNEIVKASQVVHEGPPHKQEKKRKELTDLWTKVRTYVCAYIRMCHEGSVYLSVCIYACTCIHTHMYVHIYVCM